MNEIHTFQTSEGINLHCIKDNKFTHSTLTFFIRMELTKQNATKAALLSFIIKRGCKEYPSVSVLNRKLQELYGCELDVFTFKKNCQLVLCLDIKFINNTEILPKVFSIAGNLLLTPKIFLNRFTEVEFSNGLFALSKKISSLYNDKNQYATFRLFEEMANNAIPDNTSRAFGVSADGDLKELSLVTPSSLYEFYSSVISSAPIDVYFVGNKNADDIRMYFEKIPFFDMARKKIYPCNRLKCINSSKKHVVDYKGLNQTILAIGYTFSDGSMYAAEVFNELLSGGGNSVLFNDIRQQNGLCYSISSNVFPQSGVISVQAGIDEKNMDKTITLINQCIKKLENCDENDIKEAKERVISKYNIIPDIPSDIIGFCFSCRLNSVLPNINEYTDKIGAVSKGEISALVNSINEQIIYSIN